MTAETETILVTGAAGQIGSELVPALRTIFGQEKVIATDLVQPKTQNLRLGPFEQLDVTQRSQLEAIIRKYRIKKIYHLAAILSAKRREKSTKSLGGQY